MAARLTAPTGLAIWLFCLLVFFLPAPSAGQGGGDLRIATYNADLSRRGPGLLLRDILSGDDKQIAAVVEVIAQVDPDILLLTKVDYDHDLVALNALAGELEARGAHYPHLFAFAPNSGMQTGRDITGDGRRGTADDAQGYGRFAGAGGMALLSRFPVMPEEARDFSGFLWRDLPDARLPQADGVPFPSEDVFAKQRLSSTGHWDVPLRLPAGGRLHLLAWYAGPPVFGGPHERNLRRNHDETRFWSLLLDDALPMPPPDGPFVLLGDSNLDPHDGDGDHAAMRALLAHPALQDPQPRSHGGVEAATGPLNTAHVGDPGLDTTHWTQEAGPGNLRVDYVLPSADLRVHASGVFWPAPGTQEHDRFGEAVARASRHRLVWADIAVPRR